ncbi:MAG: phage integrase N-terminal SAM-like domain-containing protein, partial [Bacteroidota bacterium]
MENFLGKIQIAYETAYCFEMSKKYTKPRIFHGGKNFDLKKRWYVYYSYVDPESGKMKRQTPVTLKVNRRFKTKSERLTHLQFIRKALEEMLKNGFNPYEKEITFSSYNAEAAIDHVLSLKKEAVGSKTYQSYKSIASQFKTYLQEKAKLNDDVKQLDKRTVSDFLNRILKRTSPATRNSYRNGLSVIFQALEDNELIDRNFVKNIKPLKTNPERNKTYDLDKVNAIYEYLEQSEPLLLLLVKFVSYNFLRPVEACRLQVKDLELNSHPPVLKTKIIPDVILAELQQLDLSNPDAYLITHEGVAESDTSAEDRRDYFTKRYKTVKEH